MKKIFLSSLFAFAAISFANAQEISAPVVSAKVGDTPIQKGNWLVGGSIGSLGYSFEAESFNINVSPQAGYFISDGIALGLTLGGGYQSVKNPGKDVWTYNVMPFARYYFTQGASATGRFFGQGNIGISGASAGGSSSTSFAFGINGGYAHFFSRTVALEVTAGYNYSKSSLADATKQSGLGAAVGLQVYLPGGKNKVKI